MEKIVGLIYSILIILQAIMVIVGWLVRFAIWLHCHKKEACYSETCPFREWCEHKKLSEGEWNEWTLMLQKFGIRYNHKHLNM